MPKFTDQHLVFRVSAYQDQDAFGELHRRYYPKIYRLAAYKLARAEDAEDITSQVFLKIWEYLTQIKKNKIQNFRAFIYKIARNDVANFYRTHDRIPETLEIVELDNPEEYLELTDAREDIFKKQLNIEDIDNLIEYVQKLPEPYKEVIALRFFEELDIEEIAEILEKTQGHVRVLIHRGIQKLRAIIGY